MATSDGSGDGLSAAPAQNGAPNKGGPMSIERIYQKKTQLEHVLLRPDTYVGSVEPITQNMWVYDGEEVGMKNRPITFVPGLYKIFDEILVNAADNKQRDPKMDRIDVEIDPEANMISIWNNGRGIPVVEHKDEKMYVPTLIFGHLLTSSNYNDDEKKVTGGRNGFGAKLCNIFSTKFTVETFSKSEGLSFYQAWENNMTKTIKPKLKPKDTGEDFTRITFYPDLPKFKMEKLDADTVALMSRRAFDVAGSTKGVKVFLNKKRLPVKGFKEYVQLFLKDKEDEQGKPITPIYESVNDRWEVAVALSDTGDFQQMSFVNSIATTKGGTHVDYVADHVVKKVQEMVKKKNKAGVKIQNKQVKDHMWVFINCLIENPTFDSQTKENMTLQAKSFGSKCDPSEKFYTQVLKCGIVEAVMSWLAFKAQKQLGQKCSSKKHSKLKGIPKLEDANDAGTRNSIDCTLILTEGDSAKTLAVSGLAVVGRDKFGVFPLRGKMLNVREASHKQILENAEINNLIKILGLQYKKKYETEDDLRTLRYGRLMIMTDQDQDGSHIKGLLINFIHHNWPSLLRLPFLEEFITPIVKASKGKTELPFYSLPEFEEWKTATEDWQRWRVKYYKGLGTSTAKEAKEYFSDMVRHRIRFRYQGGEDDRAIELAFSKKMVDQRKEWLRSGMEERKQRRELGLPEVYLYGKETKAVTFEDFVNKELILYSNMDNERSIPSLVDGLKPGQRKVLFTCFKRNLKREIKVAQLAGSVAEHSAYHHGEVSLMATIINLAQNFVGSNNINLLQPIGQFGTRLQGGKDAASPRYIFTMPSPIARCVMPAFDDPILHYLFDDNLRIEPEFYIPILPMVLVNGAEGIGTGWSTKVPNYNPRAIVSNLRRMLAGEEPQPMKPWFKNFRGTIDQVEPQKFLISGEVALLSSTTIEITELPVRTWTQTYKEQVLETMLHGSEKVPSLITDYKEYHTDTTVRFVVTMTEEKLARAQDEGLHKVFKLQTTLSTSCMVLFDSNGVLSSYSTPDEILREFFTTRLAAYKKRKAYMMGLLEAETKKLENQARFILEKIEGVVKVENRKKVEMIRTLVDRGYDPDPLAEWKKQLKEKEGEEEERDEGAESQGEEERDESAESYNYLLGMPLWSLTRERKEDLLKKRDEKRAELEALRKKSPENLWEEDLSAFMAKLDEVEKQEREDEASTVKSVVKTGKGRAKSTKNMSEETKPAVDGERVIPKVEWEAKKKAPAGTTGRGRQKKGEDGGVKTEAGDSPGGEKPEKAPRKRKPAAPKGDKKKSPAKKRNRWSEDSDSEEIEDFSLSDGSEDEDMVPALPRKKRAESNEDPMVVEDKDSEEDVPQQNGKEKSMFDSDSDVELVPLSKRVSGGGEEAFDSLFDGDKTEESKPKPDLAPKPAPKAAAPKPKKPAKKSFDSDADASDEEFKPKPKKATGGAARGRKKKNDSDGEKPKASKAKKAKRAANSSDEDDSFADVDAAPAFSRTTTGRARAPVKYNFGSDSDEED